MVGTSLVRGTTGLAAAAAQPTQLWVIPQPVFLSVYARQPLLQQALAGAAAEEFYAVASLSPSPINPERERLAIGPKSFAASTRISWPLNCCLQGSPLLGRSGAHGW